MKIGENILIAPASDARRRTKNRLREHGPSFKVRAVKKSVQCFNGAAGVFLDAPDGWFGWLRLDEIVVDK
tara:strand:+ start:174 stop:383 length:210 start_codon:yes stop_codon:yes gene_type:complete